MKKRKFNILLNIATLCLCVCAIAFGVYSAKQASLNVSGTIGFSAHNCEVYVAGQITGGIDADLNSVTSFVSKDSGATKDTFIKIGDSYNWKIGTMFFDDINTTGDELAKPITIELKVYNKSSFKVIFTFNEDFMPKDHLNITVDNATLDLPANETEADAHTINVTISLKDENFTQAVLDNATVLGNFTKWSQYRIETVTEQIYNTTKSAFESVTTNKLVTTMGHSIVGTASDAGTDGLATETPIRWFAFAVKGEGDTYKKPSFVPTDNVSITTGTGEIWYSLYGVDMTNVDYKGKTFWFIQEYVVAGGYFINDHNIQLGILFQSEQNNTYAQIDSAKPNNSKKSTIYTFLNDIDATDSYAKKTGITTEELNKIDSRNVDESYEVSFTGYNATTEGSKNYLACKFSSMFWLINHAELGLLCNQSVGMSYTDSKYTVKTYGINNQDGNKSGEGAQWWLRSPYPDDRYIAHCVSGDGNFTGCGAHNDWVGVRAAFQITL